MIRPQFLNYVNSSFQLWIENQIVSKGSGIQYKSSYFYPIGQHMGKWVYASPYQGFIANENISGNISPTGVFLSGSQVFRNQSGFTDFNYSRGWALFNNYVGDYTKVSGSYYISDVQVLNLSISEEKLLFETQLKRRNPITPTGINFNEVTFPALYLKTLIMDSKPFAFGGMDDTKINIGGFLFCESKYQLDAISSLLLDSSHSYVPLLQQFPYNIYGGFSNTGTNFNYYNYTTGIVANGSGLYIEDIQVSTFNRYYNADFTKLNPDCYWAVIDFTISRPRLPRSLVNNL